MIPLIVLFLLTEVFEYAGSDFPESSALCLFRTKTSFLHVLPGRLEQNTPDLFFPSYPITRLPRLFQRITET